LRNFWKIRIIEFDTKDVIEQLVEQFVFSSSVTQGILNIIKSPEISLFIRQPIKYLLHFSFDVFG
jgi:hypothetical protein